MATPQQLRSAIRRLTDLAESDVRALVARVDDYAVAQELLNDVLPALIEEYGSAAALVAAEWYDELRVEKEVPGRFQAPPAPVRDPGAAALAGYARSRATSLDSMAGLVSGGVQKRILNVSRQTVMSSSVADPRARGWMRVGVGNCAFCRLLISRGAVYTEDTVNFGAHDNCGCQAAPSWGGRDDVFDVQAYRRSLRNRSDETRTADNARARDWIEANL